MAQKRTRLKIGAKVGSLTLGDDGFYREKGGHIVICKACPETWYRSDEPGTQEEQWEEIEGAYRRNGFVNSILFGSFAIFLIFSLIRIWGCGIY